MRALEVWYETISVEDVIGRPGDEKTRERMKQRLEKAEEAARLRFIFPKLVEHRGDTPRIKDEPPLIFHVRQNRCPGRPPDSRNNWSSIAVVAAPCPGAVRPLPSRRRRPEGGRYRQRRHGVWRGPICRGGRRPAVPADQGGPRLGARALRRQEPLHQQWPARSRGPAPDAVRE